MQGNCTDPNVGVALAGVELESMVEGQCAIFSNVDVFRVEEAQQGLWMDNILMRVARTGQEQVFTIL